MLLFAKLSITFFAIGAIYEIIRIVQAGLVLSKERYSKSHLSSHKKHVWYFIAYMFSVIVMIEGCIVRLYPLHRFKYPNLLQFHFLFDAFGVLLLVLLTSRLNGINSKKFHFYFVCIFLANLALIYITGGVLLFSF